MCPSTGKWIKCGTFTQRNATWQWTMSDLEQCVLTWMKFTNIRLRGGKNNLGTYIEYDAIKIKLKSMQDKSMLSRGTVLRNKSRKTFARMTNTKFRLALICCEEVQVAPSQALAGFSCSLYFLWSPSSFPHLVIASNVMVLSTFLCCLLNTGVEIYKDYPPLTMPPPSLPKYLW